MMEKQKEEINQACLSVDSLSLTDWDISPPVTQLDDDEWDTDLEPEGKTIKHNLSMICIQFVKWYRTLYRYHFE